jgi:hypothetical protein
MKVIKKIRKAQSHYIREHTIHYMLGDYPDTTVCHVYIDTPQGGSIDDYRGEEYILCTKFDDYKGKWYDYHIPVEVYEYFYDKPVDAMFYEYIEKYDVPSYGTGRRRL